MTIEDSTTTTPNTDIAHALTGCTTAIYLAYRAALARLPATEAADIDSRIRMGEAKLALFVSIGAGEVDAILTQVTPDVAAAEIFDSGLIRFRGRGSDPTADPRNLN